MAEVVARAVDALPDLLDAERVLADDELAAHLLEQADLRLHLLHGEVTTGAGEGVAGDALAQPDDALVRDQLHEQQVSTAAVWRLVLHDHGPQLNDLHGVPPCGLALRRGVRMSGASELLSPQDFDYGVGMLRPDDVLPDGRIAPCWPSGHTIVIQALLKRFGPRAEVPHRVVGWEMRVVHRMWEIDRCPSTRISEAGIWTPIILSSSVGSSGFVPPPHPLTLRERTSKPCQDSSVYHCHDLPSCAPPLGAGDGVVRGPALPKVEALKAA